MKAYMRLELMAIILLFSLVFMGGCDPVRNGPLDGEWQIVPRNIIVLTDEDSHVIFAMRLAPALPFPTGVEDDGSSRVDREFWIGETPVTYALWYTVRVWAEEHGYTFLTRGKEGSMGTIGAPPTENKQHPVTTISWRDAVVWCNALTDFYNHLHGMELEPVYEYEGEVVRNARDSRSMNLVVAEDTRNGFRLPTSDEWELAARFQSQGPEPGAIAFPEDHSIFWTPGHYASGAHGPYEDREATDLVAWHAENTSTTQEVGQKLSNGLFLYDMSGNVWEFCFDWHPSHINSERIRRGGSGSNNPFRYLRVGDYASDDPISQRETMGFRIVQTD